MSVNTQGNSVINTILFFNTIFETHLVVSLESATAPYFEQDKSSKHPHTCFFKIHFNPPFYTQVSQVDFYLSTRTNICATWFSHPTLTDLFTLIMFQQEHKLRISSFCDLRQPPVTASLLYPNTPPAPGPL
jgi:hypothetical protein